jgi:hypothetical protein
MQELETLEFKKDGETDLEYSKNKPERDFLKTLVLQQLEQITNKGNNTLTHLYVLRILDIIMINKWYSLSSKDIWNLIYLANYLFDLNDIFKGTFLAERAIYHSHNIIMIILERQKGQLNKDQSTEITKMLGNEQIKNFQMVSMDFDVQGKKVKQKLESIDVKEKVQGMKELISIFNKCTTYKDQLKLFGSKTKDIMKGCF